MLRAQQPAVVDPSIENGEKLCILLVFFCFPRKIRYDQTSLSAKLCLNLLNRDLSDIKKFPCGGNRFENCDFSFISERVKPASTSLGCFSIKNIYHN